MLVRTAFMLKPLEALLSGELDGTTDNRQTDIGTYTLNWHRRQFSEREENNLTVPLGPRSLVCTLEDMSKF